MHEHHNLILETFHHSSQPNHNSPTESRTSDGSLEPLKSGAHSDFSDPSPHSTDDHPHSTPDQHSTHLKGSQDTGLDLSSRSLNLMSRKGTENYHQHGGEFSCNLCNNKAFPSWHHYKQHVEDEHVSQRNVKSETQEWTCQECTLVFANENQLQMHIIQCHTNSSGKGSPYNQCSFCQMIIPGGPEVLVRHEEGHAAAGLLKLSGQGKNEPISSPLEDGLLSVGHSSNPEGKIFNREAYCDICNKEFCNKYFLKTHRANKHGIPVGISVPSVVPPGIPLATPPNVDSSKSLRVDSLVDSLVASQSDHTSSPTGSGSTPKISPLQALDMTNGVKKELSNDVKHISPPDGPGMDKSPGLPFFASELESGARTSPAMPKAHSLEPRCSMCHQVFPSAALLQSHFLTAHNPLNSAAAALAVQNLYTASMLGAGSLPSVSVDNKPLALQANLVRNAFALGLGGANALSSAGAMPTFPGLGFQQFAGLAHFNPLNLQSDVSAASIAALASGLVATTTAQEFATNSLGNSSDASEGEKGMEPGVMSKGSLGKKEAFCDICQKQFCNKYFLKTHKFNKHGVVITESPSRGHRGNRQGKVKSPPQETPLKPFMNGKMEGLNGGGSPRTTPPPIVVDEPPSAKCIKTERHSQAISTNNETHMDATKGSISSEATSEVCDECPETFSSTFALLSHKFQHHQAGAPLKEPSGVKLESNEPPVGPVSQTLSEPSPKVVVTESPSVLSKDAKSPQSKSQVVPAALASKVIPAGIDPEAYCEFCKKEFCSKYFLKTHKLNIHGIVCDLPSQVVVSPTSGPAYSSTQEGTGGLDSSPGTLASLSEPSPTETLQPSPTIQNSTPSASKSLTLSTESAKSPGGSAKRNPSSGKNFCDICNKELCNKYFLRTHMAKMHGLKINENKVIIGMAEAIPGYKCGICGKELSSRHFLKLHKINAHGMKDDGSGIPRGPYTTSSGAVSTGEFSSKPSGDLASTDSGSRHIVSPESQRSTQADSDGQNEPCPFCSEKFNDEDLLNRHLEHDHNWTEETASAESADLRGHSPGEEMQGVDKICPLSKHSPVKCDFCPETFPDVVDLQLHNVSSHPAEMEQRASMDSLAKRQQMMREAVEATAAVKCVSENDHPVDAGHRVSTGFSSQEQATTRKNLPKCSNGSKRREHHHSGMNGIRKYRCSYCAYSTRWLSNLCVHEKRHGDGVTSVGNRAPNTYTCNVCLRSYRYQHSLQRHMSVHKQFATIHNLQQFQQLRSAAWWSGNSRSGGQLYSISGGTQLSPQKSISPPEAKRHRCLYCKKHFKSKEACRNHTFAAHKRSESNSGILYTPKKGPGTTPGVRVESPRKVFRCKMCGIGSRVYAELREHLLKEHGYVATPSKKFDEEMTPEKVTATTGELCNSSSTETARKLSVLETTPCQVNIPSSADEEHLRAGSGVVDQPTPEMKLESNLPRSTAPEGLNQDLGKENAKQPFIMQPFVMREKSDTGLFISSMVYLPVVCEVKESVEASFTFTPLASNSTNSGDPARNLFMSESQD